MTSQSDTQCPAHETIAELAEGSLKRHEIEALLPHIESCPTCRTELELANQTFHEEARPASSRSHTWWSVAGAAAAAAVIVVVMLVVVRARSPIDELAAIAPRSARNVEARLTGGFAYAPYGGPMRAGAAPVDREQMKLIGAAGEMLERAERDPSPEVQRAGAVAMVLINRADEGIVRLAAQAKQSPTDARAWSDLAAAQYASALSGRASLYPEALASADRALHIDPRLPEALFNRALILERLGLRNQARAAWQSYLDHDSSSAWAAEAREHLGRLAATGDAVPFETDRQSLETAAAAGNAPLVGTLVGRHGERARAYAEVEYLGRWAEALQKKEIAEAAKWLTISRNIGAALAGISGESLLRDAVRAIDAADAARQQRIAEAHVVYRRGRIAFSRRDLSGGERDLRLAAAQFAAAGDPMSFAARSYAAGARLAQNDVVAARGELTALAAEVDAVHGYLSLAGQVRWELARCLIFDGDWKTAAGVLAEAETLFRRADEPIHEATIAMMLADAWTAAGRPDDAWSARTRAFETFAVAGTIEQLQIAVDGAAADALRAGNAETARALTGVGEWLARDAANDLLLADMLTRKSLLDAASDPKAAERAAAGAAAAALRIPDAALRARHLADADLAMAAALAGSDARRSSDLASRALETYTANGLTGLVAEPYLVRARASLRLGDRAAAARDLGAGIDAVEQHPASDGGTVIGTGVLDAGNALFEEAIGLDLDGNDVRSAFAHAERSRGVAAGAGALDELRGRLAGSGTAVVVSIVLPRELVVLAVTEGGASASRRKILREDVVTMAAQGDDSALHDLLIRPAAAALADAHSVIIVPDKLLERVAYAALRDPATNRRLLERMSVAIAGSATSLRSAPAPARRVTMTAIELPSGTTVRSAALPEAELELAEIGGLYGTVRQVSPDGVTAQAVEKNGAAADVVHIAGHTEGDAATGGEALAAGSSAISWRTIAAMRGMAPVVVLSACNTLQRPDDPYRRALSLGGAFVAAGAQDVFGTLAPIGDRDARGLFFSLHEQLARGVAAPEALRRVQLAQIARPDGAWRRLALLTTIIHRKTD